jgi:hypothetical protein
MEDLSSLTGTIVASTLTLLCSTVCCAAGIYTAAQRGSGGLLGSGTGAPMVLFGLLVWLVPPLLWSRSGWSRGEDSEEE